VPPFHDTFFNVSAIDDAYSTISRRIEVRNKTLTIWLFHKVYCRLLTAFVCPLQAVEDDGVGKKFSCIPLQNQSSDLPEVVVTRAGSNPALAQLFFVLQTFCCSLFIAAHNFLTLILCVLIWFGMYMEAHFK